MRVIPCALSSSAHLRYDLGTIAIVKPAADSWIPASLNNQRTPEDTVFNRAHFPQPGVIVILPVPAIRSPAAVVYQLVFRGRHEPFIGVAAEHRSSASKIAHMNTPPGIFELGMVQMGE